jgi:hypothetical protein
MREADYDWAVFLNCPFDDEYQPIFRALVFVIHDCGFVARCALETDNGGEVRIDKINRIIRECRHGIHDISRTEPDALNSLPRFNMPLELGLFLGAREFGGKVQQQKNCLILDSDRYRYQMFCSDIAGQDIRSHGASPGRVIPAVRNWLSAYLSPTILLPGPQKMAERYEAFQAELPSSCSSWHLEPHDLQFVELRTLVQEWVLQNPPR